MTRPPKPGRMLHADPPHPPTERPAIWVTVNDTRYPGRVDGRGEGGRAVHVQYTAGVGQDYLAWVQAAQVEPREDA